MKKKTERLKGLKNSFVSAEFVRGALSDSYLVVDHRNKITDYQIGSNELNIINKNILSLKQKSLHRVINTGLAKLISSKVTELSDNKKTVTFEYELPANNICSWYEIRIRKSGPDCLYVLIRNISELLSKLKQKEIFYNIAEQSQELIMVTDVTGTIDYINPKLARITGYSAQELVGKNTRIFKTTKHPEDFYFKLWNAILRGDSFKAEFYNSKKNGDIYIEEKTITPLFNGEGQITNFISTGIDVTQVRRNEQKASRYQQLQVTIDKKEQKSRTLSLIKSNEIERNKFAREIHEGVTQMLSAAMANLESLGAKKALSRDEKTKIELINQMVAEITHELRGISTGLSPIGLYEFGLYLSVKQIVGRANMSNKAQVINFISNLQGVRFKTEIEINMYRIIQEAVRNIIQHSHAKKIMLQLRYADNALILRIKDDGRGITMNNLEFKKSSTFGILNIEARAKSIGADLVIKSAMNKGFSIILSLNTKSKSYG